MFQLLIRKLNAKIFLLFVTLIGLFFNLNHGQVNAAPDTALIITGVFDGPITGGIPKFVEFYVAEDIANLSLYGFGSANNGGGTDGQEFTFPAVAATSGNFIYVATESTQFTNYFGFAPTYTNGTAPSINGDDAVELFYNGTVIDVFGDINLSGTGQAWDYLDGWAYRNDATGPDSSTFVIGSWSFSTPNATDGCTTNAACASVFPIGTYSPSGGDTPPQVSSTTPADAATDIATNTNISVDFNESVTTTAGWYNVSCSTSGDVTADYSNTPSTATSHSLTYTGTGLANSETCTITLNAGNITDSGANQLDGNGDGTGGDNYSFSFTIAAALSITYIYDIQGVGASSPLDGATVLIEGVVTADYQGTTNLDGFYVQEEDIDADTDPATSDGIFVFCGGGATCPDVAVGDIVQVRGAVDESFNQTQIDNDNSNLLVTIVGTGPLPIAIGLSLPVSDYAAYEQLEGMLVEFSGSLFINDVYNVGRYGSFEVSDSRIYNFTQVNAPDVAGYSAYQGIIEDRTILVDDGRNSQNPDPAITINGSEMSATNPLRAGYTLSSLTGVIGYAFNEYTLYPTSTLNFISSNARSSVPAVGGRLQVASLNVLNYFNGDGLGGGFPTSRGADSLAEFNRQRDKTVQAILGLDADVVGLLEMENDGYGADSAIQDLINGLNAAGGGTCGANWTFVDPGVTLLGSDEIKVAIIYCSVTVEIATGTNPVYLDTPAATFVGANTNRVPLAATFEELATGETFTVVVNHLKSKGGTGTGANADAGDGQGNWNQQRIDGASETLNWLATNPTGSSDTDIVLLGDFNSYAMEDPVTTITAAGYTDLAANFAAGTTHSYGFPNNQSLNPQIQTWGTLDYAFASASLLSQVTDAADWHINADEPLVFDYNLEFKSTNHQSSMYNVDAYRSSDHDALILGLNLAGTPPVVVEVRINGNLGGVINSNNVNTIEVLFDKAVRAAGIADPDSVENPANFVLIAAGANGVIDTTVPTDFCLNGAVQSGDDIKITLDGVTYNPATYEASVNINSSLTPLGQGNYLFVVCGSTSIVDDLTLTPLDGNNDGTGGDDFSTAFTIVIPPVAVQISINGNLGGVINSNNVNTIQVLFDRAVRAAGIADPDSVENPANFVLIAAGANGVIDTAYPVPADFCLNGAVQAGDDIKITLDGVTYNPATYEASVNINTALAPLGQGNYLFVICGSTSIVDDVTLVPLDGNNDGTGGDDFSTAFTVVFPAVGGGTGGGSGSSGGGTVVAGGIDFDGDGIADVSQLPNTGELPLWYNWIIWAGAFLLLTSFALLFFGSRADKKQ